MEGKTRNTNIVVMTSDDSTPDSSWSIFNTLATDDIAVDPGSTLPRHQTSLLGIDIAPGQMTANTLARPVMSNEVSHAATRIRLRLRLLN